MSDNVCVMPDCDRPTDGYGCTWHADRAREQLRDLADTATAARDVAQRQARRAPAGPGTSDGLPLNLSATARVDAVENALTTWVRHAIEQRGGGIALPPDRDRIAVIAEWLDRHVEWFRHRPEAGEFLTDVDVCRRVLLGVARGPAEERYLGPCGALSEPWEDEHGKARTDCPGDVYARIGAETGRCDLCGTEFNAEERRAWLFDEVLVSYAYRASEIANAYRGRIPGLTANKIRWWAFARAAEIRNGRIVQPARHPRLLPHDHDEKGRPRYLVRDVLELARQDRLRQHERQQRRGGAA